MKLVNTVDILWRVENTYAITCPGGPSEDGIFLEGKIPPDPTSYNEARPYQFFVAITSARADMRIVIFEEELTGKFSFPFMIWHGLILLL